MKKWLRIGFPALLLAGLVAFIVYSLPPLPDVEEAIALGPYGAPLSGQTFWLTLLAISVGTLISEDLACIGAGLLAGTGRLEFFPAVAAAFVGIFLGDTLIYLLGYTFGRPLVRHRWSRWLISERALDRAQELFLKRGIWIILLTRFIPGTRTATYFSAGSLHAPMGRFLLVFAFAAALWTPFLVGLSHLAGRQLLELYEVYEALALPALLGAGLLLYGIFHYGIPLFTWKGRRRLRGKWIRAVRWEYWPTWQVYWLVLLYILYLGFIRYRRPTLFTAANPCMPHGGIIGESKSAILANFQPDEEALPAWKLIGGGCLAERLEEFHRAMQELGLGYPVVLKPDEGQRGLDVAIVRSEEAAEDWFRRSTTAAILQEHVAGNEYGVFYVRHPSEPTGRIISITLKEQLRVTGNGEDTLETLIYRHPRAIAQLNTFLKRFEAELDLVPDSGEEVPLGELGTHALGSLFLDGRHLLTPELSTRVDQLARACPGFYLGRFDFKAPSEETFREGRELRILELNGLTSEAAHIYDPGLGLMHAWKTLCGQWRTAFVVGGENAASGVPVTPAIGLLRDIFSGLKRQNSPK